MQALGRVVGAALRLEVPSRRHARGEPVRAAAGGLQWVARFTCCPRCVEQLAIARSVTRLPFTTRTGHFIRFRANRTLYWVPVDRVSDCARRQTLSDYTYGRSFALHYRYAHPAARGAGTRISSRAELSCTRVGIATSGRRARRRRHAAARRRWTAALLSGFF